MALMYSHASRALDSVEPIKELMRRLMVLSNEAGLNGLRATGFYHDYDVANGRDRIVVTTEDKALAEIEKTNASIADLERQVKQLRIGIDTREEIRREMVTKEAGK